MKNYIEIQFLELVMRLLGGHQGGHQWKSSRKHKILPKINLHREGKTVDFMKFQFQRKNNKKKGFVYCLMMLQQMTKTKDHITRIFLCIRKNFAKFLDLICPTIH